MIYVKRRTLDAPLRLEVYTEVKIKLESLAALGEVTVAAVVRKAIDRYLDETYLRMSEMERQEYDNLVASVSHE